jgi:DNA-binding SARP family transcriptional activator
MLRISLLGGLRLEVDGVEVAAPSSRRARLLLALLALERRSHSREVLAARLWPGVLDDSARVSLRTALAQLRAALGPPSGRFVITTRERVALAGPDQVWTDVGEFEQLLEEGLVQAALELWSGELLTGLEDDWVYERRDELRYRLCEALALAAGEAEAEGDLQLALVFTRHQVALDPLAEEPQRELMRRLARTGDRASALAVYEKFSLRLREQLGTVPSQATRELATAMRAGAVPIEDQGTKSGAAGDSAMLVAPADEAAVRSAVDWRALPWSLQVVAASLFVGREAQLARLRECWVRGGGRERVAVFVGGEAGIGKTRLAAEFARAVHREGALVLYGRCEEGLAVPYQPFVQMLRPYVRAVGLDRVRAELGNLAPELGRLLPELAGLGEPLRGDPEYERFALFEAVAALVDAMTRQQPALLVLDDLHWATGPTLLLVRHLMRWERPLGVLLCTYRETEHDPAQALAQLVSDLHRDANVQLLSIRGLEERAIATLLEATVGHALDERASPLVHVLADQTAGNPFFLGELLADVAESGAIGADKRVRLEAMAERLEVPEGLRHVIDHRVARLSAPARRAMTFAAVAGATFSFLLLERVFGERSDVLDALDEAVAAGLLTEAGHGYYVFGHALVRQTIYESLGSARRIRLHRQLGEALEALGDTDAQAEALAYHFAQAAADGQGAKAAAYALAAGARATARLGYEEAADHYERGLRALTLNGQSQQQRRGELLLALGEAHWSSGRLDKARQACLQAAELAEQLGDATMLARAALGFCGPHRFEVAAAVTGPVADLLQRALAALDDVDSTVRARLMGRLVAYTDVRCRPGLAHQALEMARRVADKQTLADVLASTLGASHGPDALHESLALADQAGQVADEVGDHALRARAHRWRLDFLLELADIDAVERELDALQRLAETRIERYFRWLVAMFSANRAHLQGRIGECEMLARKVDCFEGHDETARHMFAVQMFVVRREQGRLDELLQSTMQLAEQYPQLSGWRCAVAYIHAQIERREQARQELDALAHADFRDLPRDGFWLSNLSLLSEVVVFLDDAPRAKQLYTLLLPYADRCAVTVALLCQGSVARSLGLLATSLSRHDDAPHHFEHALKINAQIRSPLWIAHTQHDYAHMLLRRDRSADRDKAVQLLNDALDTAKQLGLRALADKVRPLKQAARVAAGPESTV